MVTHSIRNQAGFIQQSLSQSRKQVGFFIGAGCPLSIRINRRIENGEEWSDPLIPDVAGLTKVLQTKLTSNEPSKPNAWDKVVAIVAEDGGDAKNIERLLSQIRQLKSVAGKGTVRGLEGTELEDLDRKICEVIAAEVDKPLPSRDTPYHNLAIWVRSVQRQLPVHIFTTNYDLLIEQAFEESAVPYFDGFVGSRKAFFDLGAVENETLLPSRWARLWKVHGSLNWRLEDGRNVTRTDEKIDGNSYLIYPSHLKYDQSRKMPYLAMLDRLKDFLLKPSSLLFMSGYSFGDEHINDLICRALEANPTAHVFAFLFGKLGDVRYELARNCAKSIPNLSVIGYDKAIIGRMEGVWSVPPEQDALPLPEGLVTGDEESGYELKLGDFAMLGEVLKGLSGGDSVSRSLWYVFAKLVSSILPP